MAKQDKSAEQETNKYGFTPEEMEQLTEEERAGLEDEDTVDEGFTTEKQREEESSDGDEDDVVDDDDGSDEESDKDDKSKKDDKSDDDEADDKDQKSEKKPDDKEGDDDDNGNEGEEDEGEKPEPVKFERKAKPMIEAEEVADFDDQVKSIKDKRLELAGKFDEGELTAKEFYQQRDELDDQMFDLRERKLQHDIAQKSQKQSEANTWDDACMSFLESHEDITKSKLRLGSFDQAVRMVTSDPENEGKSHNDLLQQAYDEWASEFGIKPDTKDTKQDNNNKPDPKKKEKELPPNLGKVPASEVESTDDGRFAALDKLSGTQYEAALEKLTPAEREAYLKS